MCGIFGFAVQKQADVQASDLQSLLLGLVKVSQSRGKEAAGLALCDDRDLHVYKEADKGTDFVKTRTFRKLTDTMLSDATVSRSYLAAIGHTRLVTNGSMERHENNQPVIRGDIVGIHNGIIVNDREIFERHGMKPTCDVDTEALLASIDATKEDEKILSSVGRAFREIRGTASVALLFRDTPVLLLASNNGSLYVLASPWGFVFASERAMLERIVAEYGNALRLSIADIAHVDAGTGFIFHLATGKGSSFRLGEEHGSNDVARGGCVLALTDWKSEREPVPAAVKNTFGKDTLLPYVRIYEENARRVAGMRRCARCILPETMPFIEFDAEGVCTFCRHHVKQELLGEEALLREVEKFRGDGKQPDCLFPLSGGRDSSYGLHYVKNVLKLNPVAYSYDWGMLTDLGRRNQARMCGALGVEHILISADITKKRRYIRQNVLAWLRAPDLGTVPLFMAGDKQYFFYLNKLQKQVRTGLSVYCENPLEQTNFKYGFCGIAPKFDKNHVYRIGLVKKLKMALYYGRHYLRNPRLLNASLMDTVGAFLSTYFLPHDYVYLFNYIPWEEDTINRTLIDQYDWELADDTTTTWRIGDGTAAFYNYIYYTVAGFTENDTFRSNQIREGLITREKGLALAEIENRPRFESLRWYGDTIGIDILKALDTVNAIPKRYR